ncbi:MAG: hypothetical protein LBI10_01010 [Deltaproteobacteria bacterium]|jgi:uncharacterized protein YfaS (alpha-2-macroglobulin family)|nr:hypothetical protein [Deltaproteobacteria bacterium]
MLKIKGLSTIAMVFFFLSFAACEGEKPSTPTEPAPSSPSSPKPSGPKGPEPKILQFLPSGPVKALNQIVVNFDQPMARIGEYQNVPTEAFVLDPPLPGQLRWLNEYSLVFTPDKPLTGSATITATLKPGLKSVANGTLTQGATTTITLPPVQASSVSEPILAEPQKGYRPSWRVFFNQALDLSSLNENSSFIVEKDEQQSTIKAIWTIDQQPKRGDQDQSFWPFVQPAEALPFNATVKLVVAPNLKSLAGPIPTLEPLIILSESTPAPLTVILDNDDKPCGESAENPCLLESNNLVDLTFNNNIYKNEIINYVSFDPPFSSFEDLKKSFKNDSYDQLYPNKYLYIWGNFKGLTNYAITIKAGAPDIYGQTLAKDQKIYFKTDALRPEVNFPLQSGFLETKSSSIIPISIANRSKVVVNGYPLTAKQTLNFLRINSSDADINQKNQLYKALFKNVEKVPVQTFSPPNAAVSEKAIYAIDLVKFFGDLALGRTLLLTTPDSDPNSNFIFRYYQRTDMALTAKIGLTDGLVWLTSVAAGGESLANAQLAIYGPDDEPYWEGVTDDKGLAQTPGLNEFLAKLKPNVEKNNYRPLQNFYLVATYQGQLGVWNLDDSYDFSGVYFNEIQYSNFNPNLSQFSQLNFLLSAQPIYQPGEVVKLKGISRNVVGDEALTPTAKDVTIVVYSPKNVLLLKETIPLSSYGTFYYEFSPKNPPELGQYSVYRLLDPNFAPPNEHYGYIEESDKITSLGTFKIYNFRPAAFDLTFEPVSSATSGQKIPITATGTYHFGSPATGLKATYGVTARTNLDPAFPRFKSFTFYDGLTETKETGSQEEDYETLESAIDVLPSQILSSEGLLDEKGRVKFDLTIPAETFPRPRTFEVNLAVADLDQRVVTKSFAFLAHPADLYVGLKSDGSVFKATEPVSIDLVTVDLNGDPKEKQTATVEFFRRSFQTVRRRAIGATYPYFTRINDEKLQTLTLVSGPAPISFEVTPDKPGYYYALASIKDAQGRENKAATSFYVYGPGPAGWDFRNDEIVNLIPDRNEYAPGDTAKILVQSPFQTGTGLMTVERSGIRKATTFKLDGQSPILEVPLTEDDQPNVYVSVILNRPRVDENLNPAGLDLGKPTLRKGYIALKVTGESDLLKVTATPDKPEYQPRDQVTVDLLVKDSKGQAATGEVAVAVVDAGVVQVGGSEGYFPDKEFLKDRPLMVYTFNNLSSLIGRRAWNLKFASPPGGGGLLAAPLNELRSRLLNLAYFEPFVQLDPEGQAQVTFTLPDNLTTFKIYAVATGHGRRSGTAETQILSTKNLTTRSALPAQVGLGDEFTASVIVASRKDSGQATVAVKAENLEFIGSADPKTITLTKGVGQEVSFRVKATKPGAAYLEFTATMGQDQDAARFRTQVNYKGLLTTQAAFRDFTAPTETDIPFVLPPDVDPSRGGLNVELAPTLAPFLNGPWESLKTYPYNCLEQSTSKALGALSILRVKNWLGLPPEKVTELKTIVTDQLDLLATLNQEGGYSMWPERSGFSSVDPLLTAYVLEFYTEAIKDSFPVSPTIMNQTIKRVTDYLALEANLVGFRFQESKVRSSFRAYASAILRMAGQNVDSFVETLYQDREKLDLFELLYLTRAINYSPKNKTRTDRLQILLGLIANNTVQGPGQNSIPALWLSPNRITALTMLTLAETAPFNALLPELIRHYSQINKNGSFGTTQDNVTALLALTTYINKAETEQPDLKIAATLSDKELLNVAFKSFMDKPITKTASITDLKDLASLKVSATGQGRVYGSFRLGAAPIEPDLSPVSAYGLNVSRIYEIIKPETQKSDNPNDFKRGQVVRVTVTFMTPVVRSDLILEDPVPAGFEPINFNLKDSDRSLIPLVSGDDPDNEQNYFWYNHVEFWPNRVLVSSPYVPPGVYSFSYLIRPATPGVYRTSGPLVTEMYSPESFGRGPGQTIVLSNGQ